jgi:hypothetical protein
MTVRIQRRKKATIANRSSKRKKRTPMADAGEIIGDRVGKFVGYPMLKGVGRWLGTGIGAILGSGDYQMVGSAPRYNVLASDAQVPKFSTTRQTNVVCHREYITDIQGTQNFTLQSYPLNPGLEDTFPWLSTVAQNYQEYRIHGLIFEFRPLITDFITGGAPGVIVMATNYNADAPLFTSKQEMENSEYAVATKPTLSLIHGVECATNQTVLPEKYVRTGNVPTGQDLRLYDLGSFQLATQGNPTQLLGELWVSYCVEFYKPILPVTTGGDVQSALVRRSVVSSTSPLGTINLSTTGTLALAATATTISWPAQPGNKYRVTITWNGTTPTACTPPTASSVQGLAPISLFAGNLAGFGSPPSGTSSPNVVFLLAYVCIANTPQTASVTLGTAGIFPTGTTEVAIEVSTIDSSVSYS